MNDMKKIISIAATAALTVGALTTTSVSAQSLVAAWDFYYPASFGGFDVDGDFVDDSSVPATYGTGTFSWSNQTSSGLLNAANLSSNNLLRPAQLDTMGEGFGWFVDANNSPNAILTLSVDLTGLEDVELTFAHAGQNGSFNLIVAGETFSPTSDALGTVDLDAFEGGLANINFTFANFSGVENSFLDNIQITGVPEPSTYAAIFGVIALGIAVARRRK